MPGGARLPLPQCDHSPTPARLQLGGGSGQGGLSPVGRVAPLGRRGRGGACLVGVGSAFPPF